MGVIAGIPLILLAGLLTFLAYRLDEAKVWHLLSAAFFGFFLAATGAGPLISSCF